MSDHGLGMQIQVTPNTMFQHDNNFVIFFYSNRTKSSINKMLSKHISGHIDQVGYRKVELTSSIAFQCYLMTFFALSQVEARGLFMHSLDLPNGHKGDQVIHRGGQQLCKGLQCLRKFVTRHWTCNILISPESLKIQSTFVGCALQVCLLSGNCTSQCFLLSKNHIVHAEAKNQF